MKEPKNVSSDEKTFSDLRQYDTNQYISDVKDDEMLNNTKYFADFEIHFPKQLTEDGQIHSSTKVTQEKSREVNNETCEDPSNLIKRSDIADEERKTEASATESSEPKYPSGERKALVRFMINSQSPFRHDDEFTVTEAVKEAELDK